MLKQTFNLNNIDATLCLAQKIANAIVPDFVIALNGDLGSGKTALTRFILQSMGIEGPIKSPTFTIVEPYTTPNLLEIYHFDLYRFNDQEEWFYAGMDEYFSAKSICFIEWAEKAQKLIPKIDWLIEIIINDDANSRTLNVAALTKTGELCLRQLIKQDAI